MSPNTATCSTTANTFIACLRGLKRPTSQPSPMRPRAWASRPSRPTRDLMRRRARWECSHGSGVGAQRRPQHHERGGDRSSSHLPLQHSVHSLGVGIGRRRGCGRRFGPGTGRVAVIIGAYRRAWPAHDSAAPRLTSARAQSSNRSTSVPVSARDAALEIATFPATVRGLEDCVPVVPDGVPLPVRVPAATNLELGAGGRGRKKLPLVVSETEEPAQVVPRATVAALMRLRDEAPAATR